MSLKLKDNNISDSSVKIKCFYGLLASFFVNHAVASDLELHGFIAQGMVKNVGSDFINDGDSATLDLTEVGVNFSYQWLPNLRVAGQAVYLNGGNRYSEGARVDYLLADWNFYNSESWQNHFYLGRIKNYHWLYSSTRDVPMTRPSIFLPQSVYFDGTRDMSVGGDGIAFSNKFSDEYLGEFDFNISSTLSTISQKDTKIIINDIATGNLEHKNDLQTSIYWQPALSPWRVGAAMTVARFNYEQGAGDVFIDGHLKLKRYYFNAEYFGEKWSFSTELLQENIKQTEIVPVQGFYRESTGQGGFVQLEFKPSQASQLLMRYERYYADKNDKSGNKLEQLTENSPFGQVPSYYAYQHDFTLGFDFDFSNNLKIQLEHHWIKGTARLTPLIIPNPVANPNEHWQLSAIQLMYWF